MDYLEITHHDGTKGKISHAEAKRIAETMWEHKEKAAEDYWKSPARNNKNAEYGEKAAENIRRMAGWEKAPTTEDDLKWILYKKMPGLSECQANLLYEIMEMAAALHAEHLMHD